MHKDHPEQREGGIQHVPSSERLALVLVLGDGTLRGLPGHPRAPVHLPTFAGNTRVPHPLLPVLGELPQPAGILGPRSLRLNTESWVDFLLCSQMPLVASPISSQTGLSCQPRAIFMVSQFPETCAQHMVIKPRAFGANQPQLPAAWA